MSYEELIIYFQELIIWIEKNCFMTDTLLVIISKLQFEINKLRRKLKNKN